MNFDWKIAFVSDTFMMNGEREGPVPGQQDVYAEQQISYADDTEDQATITVQTRLRHDKAQACDCAVTVYLVDMERGIVVSQMSSRTTRLEPTQEICFEQRALALTPRHEQPNCPASYTLSTFIYVDDAIVCELTAAVDIGRPCLVNFRSETSCLLPRE
ncbi:DUF7490 domain-containing protein [Paenibacillus ferrarius]|uniref:DUF7490 domain-containing protein n=1 Tax=Paenibacillus ferrarius TaxID=1469647 RepID=UPI003D27AAB3